MRSKFDALSIQYGIVGITPANAKHEVVAVMYSLSIFTPLLIKVFVLAWT